MATIRPEIEDRVKAVKTSIRRLWARTGFMLAVTWSVCIPILLVSVDKPNPQAWVDKPIFLAWVDSPLVPVLLLGFYLYLTVDIIVDARSDAKAMNAQIENMQSKAFANGQHKQGGA